MRCCGKARTSSPTRSGSPRADRKEEVILRIPGASAHLLEPEESVQLAKGDLVVLRFTDEESVLATVIKVGPELKWPLARDEPVVKVDELHYMFSLPVKDGGFLNYGVSFAGPDNRLISLDTFLKENSCLSTNASAPSIPRPTKSSPSGDPTYWSKYLPSIGDYNKVLEKAIAGGTGQIVRGIYAYTDAYSNQVQKGAQLLQPKGTNGNASMRISETDVKVGSNRINKSIRRVRKISEMTEKMSRSLLDGVITVTGAVGAPISRSKAGKAVLGSFPGSVLLASVDSVSKVLDALETAERKTIASTGGAVAGVVSKRFGENAGQATEDLFATAGHTVGTAWNCFKIRKAITPSSSSVSSSVFRRAVRKKT